MTGAAAPATVEHLGGDLHLIDTLTAGMTKVTAGYLIAAPRPVLIECGPALSIGAVLGALDGLGLDRDDLAFLVLSHIHLDHAGGAGEVAAAFPAAQVVVSEFGAPHLRDPERLNASSRRVYGALMDTVYGACSPVDAQRIRAVADRDTLDLGGGRRLELFATPGHARHHIGAFEPDLGALFVGDSVGVRLPGMSGLRPATPPPDFDLVLARRSIDRYRRLAATTLYLAHYGPLDHPGPALDEADDRMGRWTDVARAARAEHDELEHVAETLALHFPVPETSPEVDAAARLELLNGYRSNAMGLLRYLQQQELGRTAAG